MFNSLFYILLHIALLSFIHHTILFIFTSASKHYRILISNKISKLDTV